jgi:MFS family permease
MAKAAWTRKARVDLSPLRGSRDFRLLVGAGAITSLGSLTTYVALPFQVKELTGSFVAVGLLGAVELVPLVVFGLWGGAIADARDRRRVVIACEAALLLCSAALLANGLLPEPQLWVLYAVAALFATLDSLQRPSLDAIVPRVVPHDQLAAAAAINAMKWQLASLAGPALAGFLIAGLGVTAAYGLDVATYALSLSLLWRLRPVPAGERAARSSLAAIAEAARYAWGRKDLLGTYAVDTVAMLFAFPMALFPFVADELGAPWALGLLYTAPFAGSLAMTLTSGWTGHVHRHGRAIFFSAMAWGVGIAAFGLATDIWWALLFLALAGAADMSSGLFRTLMWNQTIPDDVRGRMAGIELLSYSLGPTLGQLRASTVAQLAGLRFSIVSGGVLCVAATAMLIAALPSLWRYDARTNVHAQRQREAALGRERPDGEDAPGA